MALDKSEYRVECFSFCLLVDRNVYTTSPPHSLLNVYVCMELWKHIGIGVIGCKRMGDIEFYSNNLLLN